MAKAKEAMSKTLYSVHPGVAMAEKWVRELKVKTGRSLEEWIALARKEGPTEDKGRRAWLKTKHNLGTNSARWISERVDGKGTEEDSPEAYLNAAAVYVEEQYAGTKEKLRPIYDELLRLGKSLGEDVKAPLENHGPLVSCFCSQGSRRIRGLT